MAEPDGRLNANRGVPDVWETFTVLPVEQNLPLDKNQGKFLCWVGSSVRPKPLFWSDTETETQIG